MFESVELALVTDAELQEHPFARRDTEARLRAEGADLPDSPVWFRDEGFSCWRFYQRKAVDG